MNSSVFKDWQWPCAGWTSRGNRKTTPKAGALVDPWRWSKYVGEGLGKRPGVSLESGKKSVFQDMFHSWLKVWQKLQNTKNIFRVQALGTEKIVRATRSGQKQQLVQGEKRQILISLHVFCIRGDLQLLLEMHMDSHQWVDSSGQKCRGRKKRTAERTLGSIHFDIYLFGYVRS